MGKKLTTEDFIKKAKLVHVDKYDYSLVEYVNNHTKVKIVCSVHGIFEQDLDHHLRGHGCSKCVGRNKTNEEFINQAKIIHGDKYGYSLVDYVDSHTKINIVCKTHGIFKQTPTNHIHTGSGCPTCGMAMSANANKTSFDDFIKMSKIKHNNKYEYSLVEYVNSHTKVKIICPRHGTFKQTPNDHLNWHGCDKCKSELTGDLFRSNTVEFIKKAEIIHGGKYDYGQTTYINNHTKVKIICPEHGEFLQTPNDHLGGAGCPNCFKSKGEINVRNFLEKNNVLYIQEKRFDYCKYKNTLPYDFYLPEHNILIEYDGIQHFEPIKYFGGEEALISAQLRDKIKTDYAIANNIKLIRIRYNENIEEKLYMLLV